MKSATIVLLFVVGTVLSIAGAAVFQYINHPKCTYSYDLEAGVITANCPITDAGLYDEVLVKTSGGMYITQAQRIADLNLHLVKATNGLYIYTFTPPAYYGPNAWVMVDFSN